jgi:hypothetical protein
MPNRVYSALFAASWHTIRAFAEDPKYLGAKTGMVAVLHSWGQQLWLHPHLHCIVPGGGLTPSQKWKPCKYQKKYLFPKRALSMVFRAKYMAALRKLNPCAPTLSQKRPSKKSGWFLPSSLLLPLKTVVEYLGRYSHKTAISNHRLVQVNENGVAFTYKDYRDAGKKKLAHLSGAEFLRGLPAIFFLRDLCESATMGFWPPETRKLSLTWPKRHSNSHSGAPKNARGSK